MNGVGEYRGLAAEQAAFLRFVGAIAAEEQRIYWRGRGEGTGDRAPAAAGRGGAVAEGEQGRGRP